MKTTRLILLFLMTILLLTSCTKDTPPCCDCPVPYSETGRNIVGCKMDGVPWRICYKGDALQGATSVYRDNNNGRDYFSIVCKKNISTSQEGIYLDMWSPQIGIDFSVTFAIKGESTLYTPGVYDIDFVFPYHMEITHFDTINRIVSGRFECTLKLGGTTDPNILDTITITDGVFDTHY